MEPVSDDNDLRPVVAGTWIGFGAMCVGMFMAILDVKIVATSLPTIQGAFGIAPDQMSWVRTAYLIAEVIAIPLTGVLMRVLSMRWLFVASVAVFTLASIGCAASGQFTGRLAGPARLFRRNLDPGGVRRRLPAFSGAGKVLATTIAGVVAVSAPTAGQIAGGWLTATFSWHWLFLINVLPGLLSILVAARLLPKEALHLSEARTLDHRSLVLIATGVAALVIALSQAPERGWGTGSCSAFSR